VRGESRKRNVGLGLQLNSPGRDRVGRPRPEKGIGGKGGITGEEGKMWGAEDGDVKRPGKNWSETGEPEIRQGI